mmetsp:Transcript_13085/g.34232  ORF Transcript_13085/g.34232 Transcript_13085/m.34232 type:complete len:125 (-) Transcript_13085:1076-1450(-)
MANDERKKLIKLALQSFLFTCAQGQRLVECVGDSAIQMKEVAIALYARLVDPHRFSRIMDCLYSEVDRDEVREAILHRDDSQDRADQGEKATKKDREKKMKTKKDETGKKGKDKSKERKKQPQG